MKKKNIRENRTSYANKCVIVRKNTKDEMT